MEEPLHSKSANQEINAYEKFITALNSRDSQAMFEVMHVPHIRISGNGVVIYETKEQLRRP